MVTAEMLLFPNIRRSTKVREYYLPFTAPHWRRIRFCVYSVGTPDTAGVRERHITGIFCLHV
jgi:hypothetical protein